MSTDLPMASESIRSAKHYLEKAEIAWVKDAGDNEVLLALEEAKIRIDRAIRKIKSYQGD